jgi:hypothetical protein
MNPETLIPGIILIGIGFLFFLNYKNMAKGTYGFYQKIYTEHNLTFMFRISGVILAIGGLILIFVK